MCQCGHSSACCLNFAQISFWPRDPDRKCDSWAQALDQMLCLETDAFPAHWYRPFHHLPPSLPESIFVSMETDFIWRIIVSKSFSKEGFSPLSFATEHFPYSPDLNYFLNWGSTAGATVNTLVWSELSRWMQQQRDSIKWKLTQSSGESFCLQCMWARNRWTSI